jgi:hypothetical protein
VAGFLILFFGPLLLLASLRGRVELAGMFLFVLFLDGLTSTPASARG